MRRSSPLIPVLVCLFGFFLAKPAWATACPASQPVYVAEAMEITCIETAAGSTLGTVTVLVIDTATIRGVAFGPDGFVYWTNAAGAVNRFNPTSRATSPSPVATISDTLAGVSFSSSNGSTNGDLLVTGNNGVYLIQGAACVGPGGVSCSPSPLTVVKVITFSPSITAGGNAFDVLGAGEVETQLIVDQKNNQILRSTFSATSGPGGFNSATPLPVSFFKAVLGQGIYADFCGDALVASGNAILRESFSFDKNNNLVVTNNGAYAKFGNPNNTVQYFAVTATNRILAATVANSGTGTVWSVAPVTDSSGVPSCSATPAVTALASLASGASGVAVGPTSITITQTFNLINQSQTQMYNFGLHKLFVTFEDVLQQFTLPFTAVQSLPGTVVFCTSTSQPNCPSTSAPFQSNTVPMNLAPYGGKAIQYVTPSSSNPVDGGPQNCLESGSPSTAQYGPCPPDPFALEVRHGFSTDDFLLDPGVAQANGDCLFFNNCNTNPIPLLPYAADATQYVWFADTTTGTTGGTSRSGFNSTYVDFNEVLKQVTTAVLESPTGKCGTKTTPTCNPPFNPGANIKFAVKLTPTPSLLPIARISIAKVQVAPDGTTIQILNAIDVVSTNNVDVANFLKFSSSFDTGTYDFDSSAAAAAGTGLYQATIVSDSFDPVVVFFTIGH